MCYNHFKRPKPETFQVLTKVYGPQTESKKTQKDPVFEKFSKSGFESGSDPLISYFEG